MKRILTLLTVFCLIAATSLSAQHFGLRVGLNATNAKIDLADQEIETEGQTNLALGVFVNLPIGTQLISVQPELTYLNRGYSIDIGVAEQTVAYLDLGALVRLNFGQEDGLGFYVGAGPYFSYAISGTVTDIDGERDIDFDGDRLNRGELQVAGVGGLTFGSNLKFFVEARYMGSLSNLSDSDNTTIKQNSVGINGGIMVPIGR